MPMFDPVLHRPHFLFRDTADRRFSSLNPILPLQVPKNLQQRIRVRMAKIGRGEPVFSLTLGPGTLRNAMECALHESAREDRHRLTEVDQHGARDYRSVEPFLVVFDRADILWRADLEASESGFGTESL